MECSKGRRLSPAVSEYMKCTCCGSEIKQLFTSFYCPHCEGKGQKKEGGGVDIGWKLIGNVLHIEFGIDMVKINYMDTKLIKDDIFIIKNRIEGISQMTTGNYTRNGLCLYKHAVVGDMFKIAGVGIK